MMQPDRKAMERMSKIVKDRMVLHRAQIQKPVLDLTTRCIDMILSHPEVIRPEWDTDEEKKVIIEALRAQVFKEIMDWLDSEIGSQTITF
jgi:hypothetical protein